MSSYTEGNREGPSSEPDADFPEQLRRRWLRATDPKQVLVDTDLKDVAVQTSSQLNVRTPIVVGEELTWTWSFEVVTQGNKHLTNLSLVLNTHTKHFRINSIIGEALDHQNLNALHFTAPASTVSVDEKPSVRVYIVEIGFRAQDTNTYCQDVIFGFNEGLAIRHQLCVDCVLHEDLARLEAAHEYLLYLSQQSSHNATMPRR